MGYVTKESPTGSTSHYRVWFTGMVLVIVVLCLAAFLAVTARAQGPGQEPAAPVTENERPEGLPPEVDALMPGDLVPVEEEKASVSENQRPAGLPAGVDALKPGDLVAAEAEKPSVNGNQRPAGLPPGVDALKPGDLVPAEDDDT